MDIGKQGPVKIAIPREDPIPNPGSAYPIYLLIENYEDQPHRRRPAATVISVHLHEEAAWEAAQRLDPAGMRELSVASYDPDEETR